jgi:hypothetical protein
MAPLRLNKKAKVKSEKLTFAKASVNRQKVELAFANYRRSRAFNSKESAINVICVST